MMAQDPTYERYTEWGGSASEAAFSERLGSARAQVDWLIGTNPVTDEEARMDAICAAVDAVEGSCAETCGSLSIGSFSVSCGGSGGASERDAMLSAALRVLAPTGMVYAGLA